MGPFEAGLRRAPLPTAISTEGEPRLVERLRAEIDADPAARITFARFMSVALYEPDLGYYQVAAHRPGRGGDFLTAPETHPIFGAAIAIQLEELHVRLGRPARFVVREYGAGSGALARSILGAIAGLGPLGSVAGSPELAAAIRYAPIELNPHRRTELAAGLAADGLAAALEPDLSPDAPEVGAVLANELLDAMPVHRVVGRASGVAELFVTWRDGRFTEIEGSPSSPALAERLAADGVVLADGARAEICLELDGWLAELSAGLARGAAVIIDYGHPATELYGPTRRGGTLMAYAGHGVHDDWSVAVGRQDLTAHVDFTAVARLGEIAGLAPLGLTSQAEFLVGVGLDRLLEAVRSDPATTVEAWLAIRSAVHRLLDPRASGGFRVLILGRDVAADPPLAGLAFRLGGGA